VTWEADDVAKRELDADYQDRYRELRDGVIADMALEHCRTTSGY
jgi:uncharacterized protein CbrC (UPF0167 family)